MLQPHAAAGQRLRAVPGPLTPRPAATPGLGAGSRGDWGARGRPCGGGAHREEGLSPPPQARPGCRGIRRRQELLPETAFLGTCQLQGRLRGTLPSRKETRGSSCPSLPVPALHPASQLRSRHETGGKPTLVLLRPSQGAYVPSSE